MELVERCENEWVFHEPAITPDIEEEFENALETDSQGNPQAAERFVRGIVCKCPNHIDALYHLSIWIEERGDTLTAYAFCQAAVAVGLHAIPGNFHWDRSHLPWSHLDNRPFLRAYHALAIHRIKQRAWDPAIEILSRLLHVNPNDNQGVRYELPACWFETGDISAVIGHCACHDDDASPFILYSSALAYILANRIPEARTALLRAIHGQPLVAKELLARQHPEPERFIPGAITVGGQSEAWEYWNHNGKYWQRSDTAMTLLRQTLHNNTH